MWKSPPRCVSDQKGRAFIEGIARAGDVCGMGREEGDPAHALSTTILRGHNVGCVQLRDAGGVQSHRGATDAVRVALVWAPALERTVSIPVAYASRDARILCA
jgi:hypothetical protein